MASARAGDDTWLSRCDAGRELLARYIEWARETDRFTPIRVGSEFEIGIADPVNSGMDLATEAGAPIHFRGRIDLLVQSEDGAHWLVHHRIGGDRWATHEELADDERGRALCWAWEWFFLGMKISGTIYNELRDASSFRRTVIPRDRAELDRAHAEIARDAIRMAAARSFEPRFSRESCARCSFQSPCIAMSECRDTGAILRAGYRRKEPGAAEKPRLGEMHVGAGRALFLHDKAATS